MIPIDLIDNDYKNRKEETKAERRERRRLEMDFILEQEALSKNGFKLDSTRQKALMQLVGKARQGRYSNEQIGQLFRDIFKDF